MHITYIPWLKVVFTTLILFSTLPAGAQEYGSFTDSRDGTSYKTVQIGRETWLAENMKYVAEKLSCSVDIQHGGSIKNDGCLYTWADAHKVCPAGWHLPSKVEFTRLLINVGQGKEGSDNLRDNSWENGANGSGFGARPAGYAESGNYFKFGAGAYFWSTTECDGADAAAASLSLFAGSVTAQKCHSRVTEMLSVRCVKDSEGSAQATFIDKRDGSKYKTVEIAGRTWMAENMKYISAALDYKITKSPKEYGYLYNFEDAKKVCPAGWELPSKVDFDKLLSVTDRGQKGSDNLRDKLWENGQNVSGFGALPAGYCDKSGCVPFDTAAYFWSSTERDSGRGYGLYVDVGKVTVNNGKKGSYLSVRCVKSPEGAGGEVAGTEVAAGPAAPAPAGTPPVKDEPAASGAGKGLLAGSLTLGVVGAGGIGTGIGFMVVAGKQEKRRTNPEVLDSMLYLENLGSNAKKNKIVGGVALGVGGAALVTAVVLGVCHARAQNGGKAGKKQVALWPSLGQHESSLHLALSF